MCGIFGLIVKPESNYKTSFISDLLQRLAILSESRGKESAGFAFRDIKNNTIDVLRAPVSVNTLIQGAEFKDTLERNLKSAEKGSSGELNSFVAIGHSRLVTNGTQLEDFNNQPVVKDGIVGIHNGIIVNVDELWQQYPELNRKYSIDTEVMLSLFRHHLTGKNTFSDSLKGIFNEVFGTIATALLFEDIREIVLATNNGSLYYLTNNKDILLFASEEFILKKLVAEKKLDSVIGSYQIKQLKANEGLIVNPDNLQMTVFAIQSTHPAVLDTPTPKTTKLSTSVHSLFEDMKTRQRHSLVDLHDIAINPIATQEKKLLEYNWERVKHLKRCTKCLLPETFPFIVYDDAGECNYCKNYVKKNQPKPIEELRNMVEPYRRKNGSPDCIIPFSGGRDSTYVLHYAKQELGLNPIAFTYDWGMVTDLARRNIARVCGKLGVENIIVSADIAWKRENIRQNIQAWLKYPQLGMIPLFMAGDKYFFYYCAQVKKQTGVDLNIWGINSLENTDFKVGFAGIPPKFNKKRIYSLDFSSQMRLFSFVGKNLMSSPGYINRSVFDTLGSFGVRYFFPKKDYYHLFDFLVWDEKTIEDVILNEYKWETAVDTKSTWRIGDGTASFYNYIYFTVAGFTENDTFRSNQIREGLLTREEGLRLIEEENFPRYVTLKWYCEIVGLDYDATIKRINSLPKLY